MNYQKLVKNPLCLKQVEQRLWSYRSIDQFKKDLTTIFKNMKLVYDHSHPVYKQADILRNNI